MATFLQDLQSVTAMLANSNPYMDSWRTNSSDYVRTVAVEFRKGMGAEKRKAHLQTHRWETHRKELATRIDRVAADTTEHMVANLQRDICDIRE
jgi:hypothetical protein